MKPKIGIVANQRFFLTDKIDFWMSYTSKEDVEGIRDAGGLAFIISIDDASHAKEYIDTISKKRLPYQEKPMKPVTALKSP